MIAFKGKMPVMVFWPPRKTYRTLTGIHIADETVKDGRIDVTSYEPLARLGYMDYARIDDVFAMPRPRVK